MALIVYSLTMEKTASFWDSGEFIAAADKLQIVHPPGAPLYLMIGRLFSWFLPPNQVAFGVNLVSAIATAFAAMFVFWSVTIFARRILRFDLDNFSTGDIIAVIGSGLVAAFAFVFQDSQWFNASEAEVYALSTGMTAAVIWMALKWREDADSPNADRWLMAIALIIGLSIGVHLLNLLAIPAIALLYYFTKNDKISLKGGVTAFVIGMIILLFVQYGVILELPKLASGFEVQFVNHYHLPFGSGLLFLFVLIFLIPLFTIIYAETKNTKTLYFVFFLIGLVAIGALINPTLESPAFLKALLIAATAGAMYFFRTHYKLLYTASFAFMFILLGYLSFLYVPIRSAANPPIDINNPDNVFSLLSYLSREQYGDKPLLYGPVYTAQPTGTKVVGKEFQKKGDRYVQVDNKIKYLFEPQDQMLFPRLWLFYDQRKVQGYQDWLGISGKPNFMDNLKFFFTYQLDYMYWRYFMWNFAGRQNGVQGQNGSGDAGNWASGIPITDNGRVVQADVIPNNLAHNPSVNHFLMIPFVLGLMGIILQFRFARRDFWVNLALFVLTGVAIVVYLNQDPLQPRERDYAYVGSFMAFAFWIGLSLVSLYRASKEFEWKDYRYLLTASAVCFSALILTGFGTHNPQTLFPIVIFVMILLLLLFGISVGIKSLSANGRSIVLLGVVLLAPLLMGFVGWNDHNRNQLHLARAIGANYLTSTLDNAIIFTEGDNDTYPLWYAQEVENVRPDVRIVNNSLLKGDWYANQVRQDNGHQPGLQFSMDPDKYESANREVIYLDERYKSISIKQLIKWIDSDSDQTKVPTKTGEVDTFPAKKLTQVINKKAQLDKGLIDAKEEDKIVDTLQFEFPKSTMVRDEFLILDLIQRYINERPIYFTGENLPKQLGLSKYIRREGSSLRLLPIQNPLFGTKQYSPYDPMIDQDKTLNYAQNVMDWGNVASGVYLEDTGQRQIMRAMDYLAILMHQFAEQKDKQKAMETYQVIKDEIFSSSVPKDDIYFIFKNTGIIDALLMLGENDEALELASSTVDSAIKQIQFIHTANMPVPNGNSLSESMVGSIESIQRSATEFNAEDVLQMIEDKISAFEE